MIENDNIDDTVNDNIDDTVNDSNVLSELSDSVEPSINDVIVSLISDKLNLTLKTEIHNPKALTVFYMLKEYYKSIDYPISSNLIEVCIDIYLEYMVSNRRKSRREIVKILTAWYENQFTKNSNQLLSQE